MTIDFKGQNLRGRSFKHQDLAGADFSDCDLRGVDFSWADLTRAKFCRARMGKTWKANLIFFILQASFGIVVGVILYTTGVQLIATSTYLMAAHSIENIFILGVSYTLLNVIAIIIAVYCDYFKLLLWFWLLNLLIIPVFALINIKIEGLNYAEIGGSIGKLIADSQSTVTTSIFSVLAAIAIIAIVGVLARFVAGIVSLAFGVFLYKFFEFIMPKFASSYAANFMNTFTRHNINTTDEIIALFGAATVNSIILILIGAYLGKRSLIKEEPQLRYIRYWNLKFKGLGTTQFAFARLNGVDFSDADLKYAHFKNAKITNCRFQQAKNHHLALTDYTPIETRKIRDLVIDGIITDKKFSALDLRSLDFSGLNLQNFDFNHANLSGANLSDTQMTGATLEGWNIDTETNLKGIDCRYYYYYLEKGEKKRMPPEGEEYKLGEFTRIFQKIANTIDIIAVNEIERAAIKLAVEKIRVESGNDGIRVQAIEEKDGFIVVKVTVPKSEDRGLLYHKINSQKQEFETKIQLLMTEKYAEIGGFKRSIELLKEQLKEQRQEFYATIKKQNLIQIGQIGEVTMGNKSTINTTITGSTVNNSGIMNLGEISGNVTQTIEQLPESLSELKILLNQLQSLISESGLKSADKQEAFQEIQNIATAAQETSEESNGTIRNALCYIKKLAAEFDATTETAVKIGVVIEKIGGFFGI